MLSSYINQSFENLLINGGDGKSQREGLGFSANLAATTSIYKFDRWHIGGDVPFALGNLQISDPIGGPGSVLSGRPPGRIQRYECVTAEPGAPLSADNVKAVQQHIEGETLKRASMPGKPLLVALWANFTPGLNLTLNLRGYSESAGGPGVSDTAYLIPITTVAGWTRYPFIIPANLLTDVHTGTGRGLTLGIPIIATGANRVSSTSFAWHLGEFFALDTNNDNFMGTIGNFMELDQLMILSAERFSEDFKNSVQFVPHSKGAGAEEAAMKRYFQKSYQTNTAVGTGTTTGRVIMSYFNSSGTILAEQTFNLELPMRIDTPSIVIINTGGVVGQLGYTTRASSSGTHSSFGITRATKNTFNLDITGTAGGVRGDAAQVFFHYTAEAEL